MRIFSVIFSTIALIISLIIFFSMPVQADQTTLQCALKGAIFGHSWQKAKDGMPISEIETELIKKLITDRAPQKVINVWLSQLGNAIHSDDYYWMIGDVIYRCLDNGGV